MERLSGAMPGDTCYAGVRDTAVLERLQPVQAARVIPLYNLRVIQVFKEVEPYVFQVPCQRAWIESREKGLADGRYPLCYFRVGEFMTVERLLVGVRENQFTAYGR